MAEQVKHTGGCLCEGVRYEYTGDLRRVVNCYCRMCRKAVGGAFVTCGMKSEKNVTFVDKSTLKEFRSSAKVSRFFCSRCGCSVYDTSTTYPDTYFLFLPTVDGDPGVKVEHHMFVGSKAPWVEINDDLPQSVTTENL